MNVCRYLALLMTLLFVLSSCTSVPQGIEPVNNFELPRYLGKWYEIARYDHSFESGLEQVTAEYSMQQDGGVKVVNRGFNPQNQQWKEAVGQAYFVQNSDVGHLKVSFFGPFYASYVIFELDQQAYQYALITGPDRDYLWILARSAQLDDKLKERLLTIIKQAGFDPAPLIWVKQQAL